MEAISVLSSSWRGADERGKRRGGTGGLLSEGTNSVARRDGPPLDPAGTNDDGLVSSTLIRLTAN
jgi:hypothetical protein